MKSLDRVVKIANYVVKYVYKQREPSCTGPELQATLVRSGYEPNEIEAAFRLLHSISGVLKSDETETASLPVRGHRVFSPAELRKISVPCQGEILRLVTTALISQEEMGKILAEALKMENYEVGLKELELILHKVINDEERLLMILVNPGDQVPCFVLN